MIRGLSEEDLQAKQEGSIGAAKAIKEASAASSRLWLGLKDPRIVRVSRTLGGKDRHSKVRTVRGLRDRRVRLSVPTAILLYDLQERLGLSQPSKVVDWLLNAARHEIDKLPPLHFPPGIGFDQSPSRPQETNSSRPPTAFDEDQQYWTLGQTKGSRRIDQNDHDGARQVDVPNSVMYMAPSNHLDPCHVGTSNLVGNPTSLNHEPVHDYRPTMVPSSLSLMPSPQLMLCPYGTLMPSTFQSYAAASAGYDLKCIGHYHVDAASSQNPPPVSHQPVISTMVFPAELLQRESPFPNAPQK